MSLRPNLKMIQTNLMTGQQLLKKIIISKPDDRTGIWLTDVLGGTGKTVFFQSQIESPEIDGIYLRVSEGVERLSAKLRKKINNRLESGKGYPRTIWVNFDQQYNDSKIEENSKTGGTKIEITGWEEKMDPDQFIYPFFPFS